MNEEPLSRTILIVDYSKINLAIYELFVKKLDFSITILYTPDGCEALKIYKETDHIDLVITANRLGSIYGIDLVQKILEINKSQDIVFISAEVSIQELAEPFGIEFVRKPFTFDILAQMFQSHLQKKM